MHALSLANLLSRRAFCVFQLNSSFSYCKIKHPHVKQQKPGKQGNNNNGATTTTSERTSTTPIRTTLSKLITINQQYKFHNFTLLLLCATGKTAQSTHYHTFRNTIGIKVFRFSEKWFGGIRQNDTTESKQVLSYMSHGMISGGEFEEEGGRGGGPFRAIFGLKIYIFSVQVKSRFTISHTHKHWW